MNPPAMIPPLAVSARDAARMLGISEKTLFNYTKAGRIKAKRLGEKKGSRVLYPVVELERFLHSADDSPESA